MEVLFLGTSSMVPTKERNVSSIFLEHKGECFLIDCGEGTQRQLNIAGINRLRIKNVLITHWHGDHVSGLTGLLQTLSSADNEPELTLYGPKCSEENLNMLLKATLHKPRFKLSVKELLSKKLETFKETKDYYLQCAPLSHGVPVLGYAFVEKDQRRIDMDKARRLGLKEGPLIGRLKAGEEVKVKGRSIKPEQVSWVEKGKKVAVILDTALCENCYSLAEGADLLICESTYNSDLEGKAKEYKHLTASQAALIAKKAGVKKLVLTHFSQRYKDVEPLLEEARSVFRNTVAAKDFLKLKL